MTHNLLVLAAIIVLPLLAAPTVAQPDLIPDTVTNSPTPQSASQVIKETGPQQSAGQSCSRLSAGLTKSNTQKAIKSCRAAVRLHPHNRQFTYKLGRALYVGTFYKKAIHWMRKAADKGHVAAMAHLGEAYMRGRGVARNYVQAVKWHRKAARRGHARAMNNLGFAYSHGRGVVRDDRRAVRWYRQAAKLGDRMALYNLGASYYQGYGVSKNFKMAAKYFGKSTGKNFPRAMAFLGMLHAKAQGVPKDAKKAAELVYQALKARDDFARKQMLTNSTYWGEGFRRALQEKLKQGGHYHGSADGIFGSNTLRAIKSVLETRSRPKPVAPKITPELEPECKKYLPGVAITVSVPCQN